MIRIITDSAADLTPQELQRPGVVCVPLTVTFADDTVLADDGTMTKDAFFERLAGESKLPRTSQPSPEAFMKVFREGLDAGDELVVITLSQKLSGTWQCANLAAAEVGGSIYLVDSGTVTQGEAVLVHEALRLRDLGYTAPQIVAELEAIKERVCLVAVVDSLKHLQKGGRLSPAVALVGGALGIKPVLGVAHADGTVRLLDKGRGRPGALVALFKQIDKLGGIDPRYGYALVYSDDKQLLAPVHHYLHQNLQLRGGRVGQLGATIGTHVGPRAVGVAFIAKETE